MRQLSLVAIFSLVAFAPGLSVAAPSGDRPATVCLGLDGAPRPPTCHNGSTWRQDDVCTCPMNSDQVNAPYCAPGEKPAPESRDANRARHDAARHGSLIGATFEGHRFCVRPNER